MIYKLNYVNIKKRKETYILIELTAWEKLQIVHNSNRPNAYSYISALFNNFYEMQGDRFFGIDFAILTGVAMFKGLPITVIASVKGKTFNQNKNCNFAMAHPEGYRKALRQAKLAEKFKRPVICLIDTPGAFCGVDAEKRGQGQAIAQNILEFMGLNTVIIAVILGEGGSGGALGIGVCDELAVLENAVYSVISPQGAASILWRDVNKAQQAANIMKITATDLLEFKIAEEIIKEPIGGAHNDETFVFNGVEKFLIGAIKRNYNKPIANLLERRYNKFRKIGIYNE